MQLRAYLKSTECRWRTAVCAFGRTHRPHESRFAWALYTTDIGLRDLLAPRLSVSREKKRFVERSDRWAVGDRLTRHRSCRPGLFQAPADLVGKTAQRAIISIRERPIAAQPKLLSGDVTWCNSQIACAT